MDITGHNILHLISNDVQAYASYDIVTNKLTLLRGSKISAHCSKTYTGEKKRRNIINLHCSFIDGNIITDEDLVFDTPSSAAAFCMGCAINGWTAWKTTQGQTLDSLYRK